MPALSHALPLALAFWSAAAAPSAQAVVASADAVRNPQKPFRVTLKLVEYAGGAAKSSMSLTTFAKESVEKAYDTLAVYREPPRDSGKLVLFSGTKLWFYDPASKAAVRLSAQQRLLGQASVGDVLQVNLAHDYTAESLGDETLEDADHVKHEAYHVNLKPATPDAMYGHIEYWIEHGTYRPVKGKFFTDSGRLLKIAYYHHYENQLGAPRATEAIIIDGVDTKLVTTIGYSDFRNVDIPDSWFQRDYLPRVKVD